MDAQSEHELKQVLATTYGHRLKGVWVYGSEARGTASPDSDVDVLVLLDGVVRLWDDLGRAIDATFPLSLRLGRPIHAVPAEWREFQKADFALYRLIRSEGRAL